MNAWFYTFGCKVNQYETQVLRRQFADAGFQTGDCTEATPSDTADVIVINSCTVTAESDRKLRQTVRRLRREHPQAVIAVTGCMPQAFPDKAAALSEADIVCGNAARGDLLPLVRKFLHTRERCVQIPTHTREFEPMCIEEFEGRTRAFVKIEDGCDRFCSYCIIPYARGRVRSKPLAALRDEVAALGRRGYREIVLVGINLTAYGRDAGLTLADAVEAVCAVPEIARVRLGSLEPEDMTDAVIARLAAQPKLCPQFHLSLQSGCDATLRRMRRRYTSAEYAAICAALRAAFPHCAITTDIMVGFAGETEEEFAQSVAFAQQIGFAAAHIFAYSRRAGTPAAVADGQVTAAEKARRSREMIAACRATRRAYLDTLCGTEAVLLTERTANGMTEGYTETYMPLRVQGVYPPDTLLRVKIDRADEEGCYGTVIE